MRSDIVQYRPYKSYRYIAWVMLALSASAVVPGICKGVLQLWIWGIFAAFLTAYLLLTSRIVILMNHQGIKVLQHPKLETEYFAWDRFAYCYLFRNFKGNLFLVFSKTELLRKQLGYLAVRSGLCSYILGKKHEEAIVVPLDPLQNNDPVIEITKEHCRIYECW